ncbi:ABC transporter substrate-binding protein [Micromonospora sp. NBC_01638]|uniref:ABC transporter substrate-binding protein n=1 Tax=Micromonospora sp. NBC_01638 TaxID=2975982 RepID=UPI00386B1E05|nr:ABC transporter substrate-binding protein [Micromonospora sp. NBC_01638]
MKPPQRSRTRCRSIAVALAASLVLSACGGGSSGGSEGGGDIKVGVIAALTGIAAPYGVQSVNSFQMGIADLNAAGGINGRKLTVEVLDNRSKPEEVPALMRRLASGGANVIVGASSSPVTITAAQTADQLKVPLIVPMEAADDIIGAGRKYVFKLAPSVLADNGWAAQSVRAVMGAAEKKGETPKTAMLIYASAGAFPDAKEAWSRTLQKEYPGVKVLDSTSYDEAATTDFAPLVSKAKNANPDILLFGGNPQGAFLFYPALARSGWKPKATVGVLGGNTNAQFIPTVGAIADGDITGNYWTSLLKSADGAKHTPQGYADAYKAKYKGQTPDGVGAYYYASVGVLADALSAAGNPDDKESITSALRAVDIAGINGDKNGLWIVSHGVKFDAKGTNERAIGLVTQVQDGKYVPVYPADAAANSTVYPRP